LSAGRANRERAFSRFGHACNAIAIEIEIEINHTIPEAHGTHFQF
jgi:hypothetical protein